MPVALGPEVHEEIYLKIKASFADFALFDSLVDKRLRQIITDADKVEIDVKTVRKLTERYYDVQAFQTEKQKIALAEIHIILRTTYVLILSHHQHVKSLLWSSVEELLHHYPQFADQDDQELRFLLRFRNMLRVALLIIPPRLNKQLLLKIAAHLEGSGQEYITGGGQKPCVTRRVQIYEREGNIRAEKRLERLRPPKQPGAKRKRPTSQPTSREVKLLRLASDEIRALAKGKEVARAGVIGQGVQMQPLELSDTDSLSLLNDCNGDNKVDMQELEELLAYNRPSSESFAEYTGVFYGDAFPPAPYSDLSCSEGGVGQYYPPAPYISSMSMQPPAPISSTYAPLLNRETSELLDRLLPDSEYWRPSSAMSEMHPVQLMRGISWDVYNGTFTEDLSNLFP